MNDKPLAELADPEGPIEIQAGPLDASEILRLRRGSGANCSSIGSALDLLFVSATVASVVMVAVAAAFSGDKDGPEEDAPPQAKGAASEGDDARKS